MHILLGRKTVRFGLLGIMIPLLAFLVLQAGSKYLLKQWLLENGADSVTIERMGFNPFIGELTLNGVDIEKEGHTVYSDDVFRFNIEMTSLLEKDVLFEQAILRDMVIDIRRHGSGKLQIASFRLQPDGKKGSDGSLFPPWTLQAEEMAATNLTINYQQSGLKLQLQIDKAHAQKIDSSTNEKTGKLTLSGSLNGAPLQIVISGFLLEPFPSLSGNLTLSNLPLQEIEGLLRQISSSGTATISGPFTVKTEEKENITAIFDGKIEILNAALKSEKWSASGDFGWNGEIRHESLSAEKMAIKMDGLLAARSLHYKGEETYVEVSSERLLVEGKTHLDSDGNLALSSDASLSITGMKIAGETGEINSNSAKWRGVVDYTAGGSDGGQTVATDGYIAFDDLDVAIPGKMELSQTHIESKGKSEAVIGDNLKIGYDGQTKLEGFDLSAGNYSFNSGKMSYSGLSGFIDSGEGDPTVHLDGSFTAKNSDVDLTERDLLWRQKRMNMEGDFRITLGATPLYTGKSRLFFRDGTLLHDEEAVASLDSLNIERLHDSESGKVAIDAVEGDALSIYSSEFLPLSLQVESARFADITSTNFQDLHIDKVKATAIAVPSAGGQQLGLSLASLKLSDIFSSNMNDLKIDSIELGAISMPASQERPIAIILDSAGLNGIFSENLQDYTVERLHLNQPLITEGQNRDRIISMEGITALQIANQGGRQVTIEEIKGQNTKLFIDPLNQNDPPLATLAGIDVSALVWTPEQGTRIESAAAAGLRADYTKKEESAGEDEEKRPPQEETAEKPEGIPLQIEAFRLDGSSRIIYTDPTQAETFRAVINIASLDVADIDLERVEQPFTFELDGSVGKYSPLTITGSGAPLADPLSWEQLLHLKAYPVAELSPFAIGLIGARLTSGKLALESQLNIKGDSIDMENTVVIKGLETKTVKSDLLKQFNRLLPIPLDTALSFLSEDGRIKLSVPIGGQLSNLNISYSSILVTALSNSITEAVKPLLAYSVLGPGGVLVYLGMEIGKRLVNTEIPKLTYENNIVELSAEQKKTLNTVGEMLEKELKNRKEYSYYIYPKVAPGEVSDDEDTSFLDKEQRQDLYELGEERAERVKDYLLRNFDLSEQNLLIFQPGINYDEKAKGTISFMK